MDEPKNTITPDPQQIPPIFDPQSELLFKKHVLGVMVSSGDGAPSTTPRSIGLIYVDTTNSKVYISQGTSSNSDWLVLN